MSRCPYCYGTGDHPGGAVPDAIDAAIERATNPVADGGDGWESTAAVLAYEVRRLREG